MRFVLIGLFGAAGAVTRAQISMWLPIGPGIPLATLAVNIVGSFLLGALMGAAALVPDPWRAPLATGLLGSLTTFSTFSVETVYLAEQGQVRLAALNLALQLVLGMSAAAIGLFVGRAVAG